MRNVDIEEAAAKLSELVEEAARGSSVVISRSDGARFQLVPLPVDAPNPTFGSAKGLIDIGDDFDEPIEDFEDYMP